MCAKETHSEHRFPTPSSRKDVVNQCLEFGKERVGSRQTPRLRTVLVSLTSEHSRCMDCGTESELRNAFVAVRIISVPSVKDTEAICLLLLLLFFL